MKPLGFSFFLDGGVIGIDCHANAYFPLSFLLMYKMRFSTEIQDLIRFHIRFNTLVHTF